MIFYLLGLDSSPSSQSYLKKQKAIDDKENRKAKKVALETAAAAEAARKRTWSFLFESLTSYFSGSSSSAPTSGFVRQSSLSLSSPLTSSTQNNRNLVANLRILILILLVFVLQFNVFQFWMFRIYVEPPTLELVIKRRPESAATGFSYSGRTGKRSLQAPEEQEQASSPSSTLQQKQERKGESFSSSISSFATSLSSFISSQSSSLRSSNTIPVGPKRVAVVIAGTLQRFQLNSTIEHLLKPMVAQGHSVDYYISLTTAWAKAYREDMGYMDKVHWDPLFSNGELLSERPSDEQVQRVTHRSIMNAGGKVRHLMLQNSVDNLLDHDKQIKVQRAKALKQFPKEHPDARFPLLDARSETVIKRTTSGNTNILRLMLSISQLWKIMNKAEETLEHSYDYVMFLRDDTLWLEDLDFNGLLQSAPLSSSSKTDAFALSCDDRDPVMHKCEMNDHGIIISREKAKVIGNYYSEMFKMNMGKCMAQLENSITKDGKRGCNSEMMLKWIIEHEHKIKVHKVGQKQLPFQRSLNVVLPNGQIGQCFHKYCQSKKNKLDNHDLVKCTDLKYPKQKNSKSSSTK